MAKAVLVVGGGVASVERAWAQAQAGDKVYLVIDSVVAPGLEAVRRHENIQIITNADLEEVKEENGQFKVRIRRRAPRIIAEKCDDCRACIKVCPINLGDEYNQGLSLRTAIDFFHAEDPTYGIIREAPPCQDRCPVHLDVRGYIGLIADGRFAEALALIRERLPFPAVCGRICPHPCEEECNRGTQDEPVAIKALKRFVADYEMTCEAGSVEREADRRPRKQPAPRAMLHAPRDEVAIIGAGPAGLMAAHDLAQMGHGVTVLDSLPVAGGMLYVGIPDYRLPKEILQREIAQVQDLGVEIKTGIKVGEDVTIDKLFEQGYRAVFIAVGAHRSRRLRIPGEEAPGVLHAVAFLRDMNLGKPVEVGERVAVVGGGDAAMDAARSALRLGAKKVIIIYRRSRQEMPARDEEIKAALMEGIEIEFLTAPIEIITAGGRAAGMRCTRMALGEPDASRRRRPIPLPGSEFDMKEDMVIAAIGQAPDLSVLHGSSGIETTGRGFLAVDPYTLATSRAGVYAGGDCVQLGIAIEAIASGKQAALSIHRYLTGGR